jgi:hypothetical protein
MLLGSTWESFQAVRSTSTVIPSAVEGSCVSALLPEGAFITDASIATARTTPCRLRSRLLVFPQGQHEGERSCLHSFAVHFAFCGFAQQSSVARGGDSSSSDQPSYAEPVEEAGQRSNHRQKQEQIPYRSGIGQQRFHRQQHCRADQAPSAFLIAPAIFPAKVRIFSSDSASTMTLASASVPE